jgi:hypothetical protein
MMCMGYSHLQVESFLEEILLLCQRSEEYTVYLLARMGDVVAPAVLPPSKETHIRGGGFNSGGCSGCSGGWVGALVGLAAC